jgi:hypothetical protein
MRSRSSQAKRNIRARQHLMQRSFSRGTRFGFDHARWRGLWRVAIQEYLTAAIQNAEVLIRHGTHPRRSLAATLTELRNGMAAVANGLRNVSHSAAISSHAVTLRPSTWAA